jgi:predicted neuraminidase
MKVKMNSIALLIMASLLVACHNTSSVKKFRVPEADSIVTLSKEYVFERHPEFLQCHASTLVRTNDNQFLVAWFGGTHEKHDDVGIWLSRGVPGNWSAPIQVAKLRNEPHWNPVLFKSNDGTIILYFKIGRIIDQWETWFMTSPDNGITWTKAHELVPGDKGGRGPVKNKSIILTDGTWLAPSSDEKNGVWNVFVDRSEDSGATWKKSAFLNLNRDSIAGEGIIQPTLWESKPGNVHMLMRSSAGRICRSDSKDNGKTWSPVYKIDLPNPNSGVDLTRMKTGTLVLAYNRDGKNWGARRPLSLILSNNNGQLWDHSVDVETGTNGNEFSYPAIISFNDTVAMTFTWNREHIAFWMGVVK